MNKYFIYCFYKNYLYNHVNFVTYINFMRIIPKIQINNDILSINLNEYNNYNIIQYNYYYYSALGFTFTKILLY